MLNTAQLSTAQHRAALYLNCVQAMKSGWVSRVRKLAVYCSPESLTLTGTHDFVSSAGATGLAVVLCPIPVVAKGRLAVCVGFPAHCANTSAGRGRALVCIDVSKEWWNRKQRMMLYSVWCGAVEKRR